MSIDTATQLSPCDASAEITSLPTVAGARVSWTPDCAVTFFAVIDSATSYASWAIRSSTPVLTSPQQMFVTPAGASELGKGRHLQSGVPYYVVLGVRFTDPIGDGERLVAMRLFRP